MAGTKASSVDHVINMARLYTLVEWTFESKRGVEPLVFHLLCNYDHHVICEEKERERADIFASGTDLPAKLRQNQFGAYKWQYKLAVQRSCELS